MEWHVIEKINVKLVSHYYYLDRNWIKKWKHLKYLLENIIVYFQVFWRSRNPITMEHQFISNIFLLSTERMIKLKLPSFVFYFIFLHSWFHCYADLINFFFFFKKLDFFLLLLCVRINNIHISWPIITVKILRILLASFSWEDLYVTGLVWIYYRKFIGFIEPQFKKLHFTVSTYFSLWERPHNT